MAAKRKIKPAYEPCRPVEQPDNVIKQRRDVNLHVNIGVASPNVTPAQVRERIQEAQSRALRGEPPNYDQAFRNMNRAFAQLGVAMEPCSEAIRRLGETASVVIVKHERKTVSPLQRVWNFFRRR